MPKSKRSSSGQLSNTLFNYFQSPKSQVKNTSGNSPVTRPDSDEEPTISQTKKRRHGVIVDSDSDNEVVQSTITEQEIGSNKPTDSKKRRINYSTSSSSIDDNGEKENVECKTPKRKVENKIAQKLNVFEIGSTSKVTVRNNTSLQSSDIGSSNGPNWAHNHFEFLKPTNIRDINKNTLNNPSYDKRTLFVPEDFLSKQTPAMRQWWVLKSKHYDSVLFFKVGKFYELYHMDAVIGVNHLGLSYMRGEFAHSGFPETAYGKMASSLVEQGFKVARVEQTETPEMMAERCKALKKAGKFDKVVSREVCQVTTSATCVYGAQLPEAKQSQPCYMLAIAEETSTDGNKYGVCFVDTSIGVFNMGVFTDDRHYSRLLTLMAHHPPGLVLTERGCMQRTTSDVLKKTLGGIRIDTLASKSEFPSAETTFDNLMKACYFRDKNDDFRWPPVLDEIMESEFLKGEYKLALKALGACVWYLKDSKLDIQVLSMKKFEIYYPMDGTRSTENIKRDFMVVDSTAMDNLSLLGGKGTLQKTLDYCQTAFGKRMLQQWICRPLCNVTKILERQEAVRYLYSNDGILESTLNVLKRLPDLERQIAKINIFGNKIYATEHPDSRAVLYEIETYSKRKIHDLLSTLKGFERVQELLTIFENEDHNCEYLINLTRPPPLGKFVDLSNTLHFFKEAFDQKEAETKGKIIPQCGVDEEYDDAEKVIINLNEQLEKYRVAQEKLLGCKIKYFGTDKKRFQLEIPDSKTKNISLDYQLEGVKKGSHPVKRYSTAETRKFLADMLKAESRRSKILRDLNRRIFEKFSDRYEEWEQVIYCLTILDVLCSLAKYAKLCSTPTCFPTILPFQNEPVIDIENGIHPCTLLDNFVPNSTQLGTETSPRIMLLTGPNMGGKSTLMRQVALMVIMAQMGCAVPATACKISLVDRIFTRIGARDDIICGQSTLLVELLEAVAIFKHATLHSFVLLDEFGRGTSTNDGNAIAVSCVDSLIRIKCRTMFSTHYYSLVEKLGKSKEVQLAHMACMANQDDESAVTVTLLYKLREGKCPRSYGFNVAQLAGLPKSTIIRAQEIANMLELIVKQRTCIQQLMQTNNPSYIRDVLRTSLPV